PLTSSMVRPLLAPDRRPAIPHPPERERATVLVLDPDPATQRLLQILLEPSHDVRLASTLAEALACLRQEPVALVIASMELPGALRGAGVLEALHHPGRTPAVIGLTSTGWHRERAMLLASGLAECLYKPFRAHELRAAVRRVLASPVPPA
ncbi:MAG: response regulator, partial [Bacteroidetes bacterium]